MAEDLSPPKSPSKSLDSKTRADSALGDDLVKNPDQLVGATSEYPETFNYPVDQSTPNPSIRSDRYRIQGDDKRLSIKRSGSDRNLPELDFLPVNELIHNVKPYLDLVRTQIIKVKRTSNPITGSILDDSTLELVDNIIFSAQRKPNLERKRRNSSSDLVLPYTISSGEGDKIVTPVSLPSSLISTRESVDPELVLPDTSSIEQLIDEIFSEDRQEDEGTFKTPILSPVVSDTTTSVTTTATNANVATRRHKDRIPKSPTPYTPDTLGPLPNIPDPYPNVMDEIKTVSQVESLIKTWQIHYNNCCALTVQWRAMYDELYRIRQAELDAHLKKIITESNKATKLLNDCKSKVDVMQSTSVGSDPTQQEYKDTMIAEIGKLIEVLERMVEECSDIVTTDLNDAIKASMQKAISEGADLNEPKMSIREYLTKPAPPGPSPGGPGPDQPRYPPRQPIMDQTKLIRDLPFFEPSFDADNHITRFKDFWQLVLKTQPNLTKADQCFWFKLSLRAAARQWFEHTLEERQRNGNLDPEEMFKLFIERFSPFGTTEETRRQNWYNLSWKPGEETIDVFVYRAARLAKSLDIRDSELIQRIKSCAPKSIYPHIMGLQTTGDIINQIKQLQSMGFSLLEVNPNMQTVAAISTGSPALNMPFMSLNDSAQGGKQVRFSGPATDSPMTDMVSQLAEIREELKQITTNRAPPRPLKSPTPAMSNRDSRARENSRDRDSRSRNRDNGSYRNSGYDSGYGSRDNSRDRNRSNSQDRSRDRSRSRDRFRLDGDQNRGYNNSRSPSRKFFDAYKSGAADIIQAFQQPQRQGMQSPNPYGNNNNNYSRGFGPTNYECLACGKWGHSFRNCPDLKRLVQMASSILNQQPQGNGRNQPPHKGDNFNCIQDPGEVLALALQLGQMSTN